MADHPFERFRRLRGLSPQASLPEPSMSGGARLADGVLVAEDTPVRTSPVLAERKDAPLPSAGGAVVPADSRLTQRCPNPACMAVIVQANAFIHERLAGRLAADYTPLFTSAAYRQNREALIVALVEGDLDATKAVCRAWCKLVMGWTQDRHRAEAEARRLDAVLV